MFTLLLVEVHHTIHVSYHKVDGMANLCLPLGFSGADQVTNSEYGDNAITVGAGTPSGGSSWVVAMLAELVTHPPGVHAFKKTDNQNINGCSI